MGKKSFPRGGLKLPAPYGKLAIDFLMVLGCGGVMPIPPPHPLLKNCYEVLLQDDQHSLLGFRQCALAQIPQLLLISCVILGNLLHLSAPQFLF